jgi:hypothetical protein
MKTELGKIKRFQFGHGGYNDAMFGVSISLGGQSWGVDDFRGTWAGKPSEHSHWTEEDQQRICGEVMLWIADLMKQAKVKNIQDMVGVPIEVKFKDGNLLDSWRILEEVL